MSVGLDKKRQLAERGASPEEIAAWEQHTRDRLAEAGASKAEIDTYFGVGPLNGRAIDGLFTTPVQEDDEEGPRRPGNILEAFEAGVQTSVGGLTARGRAPSLALGEDENIWYSIAAAVGTMAGDVPVAVPAFVAGTKPGAAIGGAAGAAATRSPVGAAAGALTGGLASGGAISGFVTAQIRESLLAFYEDNEGGNATPRDFVVGVAAKALTEKVVQTSLKEAGIGAAGGLIGGAAGARVAAPALRELAIGAGDLTGAVVATSVIEQELPTPTEFGTFAAIAVGASAASAAGAARSRQAKKVEERLKDAYAETGRRPRETQNKTQTSGVEAQRIITGEGFKERSKQHRTVDADEGSAFGEGEDLKFDKNRLDDDFQEADNSWSQYAKAARGKRKGGRAKDAPPEADAFDEGPLRIEDKRPKARASQGDIDGTLSRIDETEKVRRLPDADDFRYAFVDDLQYAVSFTARAYKEATGKRLAPEKNPGEQMALARGANDRAMFEIEKGMIDPQTGKIHTAGLLKIYNGLGTPEQKRAGLAYITAKRVVEKADQGFGDLGFDIEAQRRIVDSAERQEPIRNFRDAMRVWTRASAERLQEAGYLSKEGLETLLVQNEDYVPMYASGLEAEGPNATARGFPVRNPTKKFNGRDIKITNPLEALVRNHFYYTQLAMNNEARRRVVDFNDALPEQFRIMDRVTPVRKKGEAVEDVETLRSEDAPVKRSRVQKQPDLPAIQDFSSTAAAAIDRALIEAGHDPRRTLITVEDGRPKALSIEQVASDSPTIRRFMEVNGLGPEDLTWAHIAKEVTEERLRKGDIIVFEDGRPITYRARDPRLVKAFEAVNIGELGPWVRALSAPAQAARTAITVWPDFVYRALIRDAVDASLINSFKTVPFVDSMNGFMKSVLQKDAFRVFIANGGAGAVISRQDIDLIRATMAGFNEDKAAFSKLRGRISQGYKTIYAYGRLTDMFNRVAQTERGLKQGLSPEEAVTRGRHVSLDFSRQGAALRSWNSMVMFLGPTINGISRAALAGINDPARLALVGFSLVTIPTILNWAAYSDEPWYQRLSEEKKNYAWWFRIGGTEEDPELVHIVKPHAWVSLFANTPRLMLDDAKRHNPKLAQDIAKSWAQEWTTDPTDITAAAPFRDVASNYDGFIGADIVSSRLEDRVLPSERFTPYTTASAKAVARVLPDFVPERFRTPIGVEHLVNTFTGNTGADLIRAVEVRLGVSIPTSRDEPRDSPFIRMFVRKEAGLQDEISRFFDNAAQADQARGTYKELRRLRDFEGAAEVLDDWRDLMLKSSRYKKAIGAQYRIIRAIEANPEMTPEEKQQLVDARLRTAAYVAERFNRVFEERDERRKEEEQ